MFFCHNKSASAGLSAAETISQTARPPPLPAPLCHSHPFSTHGWEWFRCGRMGFLLACWYLGLVQHRGRLLFYICSLQPTWHCWFSTPSFSHQLACSAVLVWWFSHTTEAACSVLASVDEWFLGSTVPCKRFQHHESMTLTWSCPRVSSTWTRVLPRTCR